MLKYHRSWNVKKGTITGNTVVVYRLSIPHNKDILCNSFQLDVWDIWDGKERVDDERRNK